jgi:hypothetical protein
MKENMMNSNIFLENKQIKINIAKGGVILTVYLNEEDQMYRVLNSELVLHSSPFLEGCLKWILNHY